MERLRAQGISLAFDGVEVLSGVDLTLNAGEVVAITGENGAGKSSLAKVIAGVYQPSSGQLHLSDHAVRLRNPREALHQGIALIHQEPLTFADLDVTESIFAGNALRRGPFVDWAACRKRASELLEMLGVPLDPRQKVGGLSVAHRQLVELASALAHDAKVWIFDETTAPLSPKEVGELFAVMRRLKEQGCAIAIVSHHLHEVFEISDRIAVLRDGVKVAELPTADFSPDEVVRLMVGRELSGEAFPERTLGNPVLTVEKLSGPGFDEVSFEVRAGEVFGIAGLVGAGRTEVLRCLFGLRRSSSGSMKLEGREVSIKSPAEAMDSGLALVPEDRIHDGLCLPQSITFNATLSSLPKSSRAGVLLPKLATDIAERKTKEFGLKRRDLQQPVSELSGGNQQKVVLAKWLMTDPKVLLLDEPTRGVDVGAKHEVHRAIHELAKSGLAVVMVSGDLNELLALSDRIAVMRGGRLAGILSRSQVSQEAIMRLAAGQETHA